jgi:type II secretory pathway component PulF
MAKYSYFVKDQQNKSQKGIVEAISTKHALNMLHDRGYFVIKLEEAKQEISLKQLSKIDKVGFNDIVNFTRQLSAMLTAGLTLVEALSILQQQITKPQTQKMVKQIEDDVLGGSSFTQALEKFENVFPPVYFALVRAGEASGKLDSILDRLADNLEKTRDFRNKLKGALLYPVIVVIGMVSVSIIIMTLVVPKLTSLYKEFDAKLPLPTLILISASEALVNYWYIFLILIILFIISYTKFKTTNIGKHILGKLSISIPIFGHLVKESTIVEMTRTLALLIDGGVPILTSLNISQEATNNILYKEAFMAASKRVEKGFKLSEPLIENKLFPPILGQMVAVGEQSGKLGDSLLRLSRYFEAETEIAVRSLTTIIEPLIMVILGIGVGFLVMAVLLPIYSLTSKF